MVDLFMCSVALGTYDLGFLSPLLSQIGNSVSKKNEVQESSLQFVIGFIKSNEPQNEIETLLAAQTAAVHVCAMDSSRRYLWSDAPGRYSWRVQVNFVMR